MLQGHPRGRKYKSPRQFGPDEWQTRPKPKMQFPGERLTLEEPQKEASLQRIEIKC